MSNQRNSPRYASYKPAHIVLNAGDKLIRCHLCDLSDTGVGLEVPSESYVPQIFDLLFEVEELKRVLAGIWRPQKKMVVRSCQTAWRRGARLGARFV